MLRAAMADRGMNEDQSIVGQQEGPNDEASLSWAIFSQWSAAINGYNEA